MSAKHQTNLNAVSVFCTAAYRGSFSAAAAELGISRAAVSQTVSKLESQLGVRLFDRGSDRLALTPDGELLFRRASPAISNIADAALELSRRRGQPSGIVRLGVDGLLSGFFLHDLRERFARGYPDIELFLYKLSPAHLIHAINNGLVDIGVFCAVAPPFEGSEELWRRIKEGSFAIYRLATVSDCLTGGAKYGELAGRTLTFADLQDIPLILPLIEFQSSDYYLNMFRRDGKMYPFDLPVSGADSRVSLAKFNHGITYFPEQLLRVEFGRGELVKIESEFTMRRYEFLAIVNDSFSISANAKIFLREINEYCAGM